MLEVKDARQASGKSNTHPLSTLLAKPFTKAVVLYQAGVLLALVPVFQGDWNSALKRFLLVTSSVGLFFVVAIFFNRPGRLRWLAFGLSGIAALVALFGTAQVKTDALRLNGFNYQVYTLLHKLLPVQGLPQVNQNVLGNFLVAFLPLALAFMLWGHSWRWRGYFALCSLLIGGAVLVTASRSALLGLVAIVVVFGLFLTAGRPRLTIVVLAGAVVSAMGGLVYLWLAGFSNIESGASRLELWRTVLGLIGDYPVTGGGLGQFGNRFEAYATPAIFAYPQPHAHNIFLQSLAEFGLAGFLAICLTLASAVLLLVRYRNLQKIETGLRPVIAGAITGIIVIFVSGLLEYGAWGGKFAPAFWLLPGMLAGSGIKVSLPAWLKPDRFFNFISLKSGWRGRVILAVVGLLGVVLLLPPVLINTAKLLDSPSASRLLYQASGWLAPWNAVPPRNLGKLAQRQGDLTSARSYFLQARARDPQDWLSLLPLAGLVEGQGDHNQALGYWREAQAQFYFIQLARQELQHNPPSYDPAEKYVKLALEIYPHYDEAIQFLVGIYMGTERKSEGAAFLQTVVAQNQDPFLYHEAAVWATTDSQRIYYLEQALRLDAQNPQYYWELGEAYQDDKQTEAAVRAYKQSVVLKPVFQEPLRSLAEVYLSQGQPQEVVNLLEKFLAEGLFVEKPDPEYVLLAQAYFALKNNPASLLAAQKALGYNPSNSGAYLVQGDALSASGQKDQARAAYLRVLQAEPDNKQAQQGLDKLNQAS